jgi:hypothetical protein
MFAPAAWAIQDSPLQKNTFDCGNEASVKKLYSIIALAPVF